MGDRNGYGKEWYDDGSVFIGKWNLHKIVEGKVYELEDDKTHTLFEVKCDGKGKVTSEKEISRGHKIV